MFKCFLFMILGMILAIVLGLLVGISSFAGLTGFNPENLFSIIFIMILLSSFIIYLMHLIKLSMKKK